MMHSMIGVVGGVIITGIVYVVSDPVFDPRRGIEVREISLKADGNAVYDWQSRVDGAHYAWSGQVFNEKGEEHCSGGGTYRYPATGAGRKERTVDWIVGDDCSGLQAGMTFKFNYQSVDGSLESFSYPKTGLGVVLKP